VVRADKSSSLPVLRSFIVWNRLEVLALDVERPRVAAERFACRDRAGA
jgi:hypothetical protein